MPLMACPECGRPVSNQAPQCPSCGFPLRPVTPPRRNSALTCGLGCLLATVAVFFLIAVMGLLAAIAIPSFVKARGNSQRAVCVRHLEELADLKATWAEEHSATNGTVIPDAGLVELAGGRLSQLWCPKDAQRSFRTSYVLNPVGVDPLCQCADEHALESADEDE
ncbi:MAG: hypothetical protein NTV49_16265 [Kiritimatiellaeota bacterium]|nr:hypothetical protein [Kiritimatiellota bacterium]